MDAGIYPRIGIVVLNFNSYADTSVCLSSLLKISYSNFEVFIIDNGSDDGSSARLLAEFPNFNHFSMPENLGCPGARNVGVELALKSGCDHILFLDDDAIVTPTFLEPLVARLESQPTIASVSGKIFHGKDSEGQASNLLWFAGCYRGWHSWYKHRGIDEHDRGQYDVASVIPFTVGCLMLVRGAVLKQIGAFSEEFFGYWEEPDWCERARKAGYSCYYEPQSVIYHNFESGRRGQETPFYNYLQFRNALIFNHKHNSLGRQLQFWIAFPLQVTYRILNDILANNRRGTRAVLWGIRDYFRGYRGRQGLGEHSLLKTSELQSI